MSETFWVFIVASTSALIGLLFKLSYDSKCTEIECCCIKIKRDVQTEERELGLKLQHQPYIGQIFTPHNISNTIPNSIPNTIPNSIPNTIPNSIPNTIPNSIPNTINLPSVLQENY